MKNILCCLCLLALLCACSIKSAVFKAPDESTVEQQQALVLPPDWEVRPPLDDTKDQN